MPDLNRYLAPAPDQPGSAGARTLLLGAVSAALLVSATVALVLFGDVPFDIPPQFLTAHAVFVMVVAGIVAAMLFVQFTYWRQLSCVVLGGAYLFSALIAIPLLFALPGSFRAEGVPPGGPQDAGWLWLAWHGVFSLLVGLSLLAHGSSRTVPRERLAAAVAWTTAAMTALAMLFGLAFTALGDRLPALIVPGSHAPTLAFHAAGGIVALLTAWALGLAMRAAYRRSALHVWLAVALVALLGDLVLSLASPGRYGLSWAGGRIESMLAVSALLPLFLGEIWRLYLGLGTAVGDLLLADRKLVAMAVEKDGLLAELRRREEEIHQLAYSDPVTGLANRRMLMDRLGHDLAQGARQRHSTSVLFLDLDSFMSIDEQFGHAAGDALLHQVGARLSRCVRSSDTVARVAGGEFVIVLAQIAHPDDALSAAEKVIRALSKPVAIAGRRVHVGASIGIASAPPRVRQDAAALLARASSAMCAARTAGRNGFRFVNESRPAAGPPLSGAGMPP